MMSPINLLILGFLMEKPMNAYELTKFIQSSHINKMIKVSVPAVYKNILKLSSKGYLYAKVIKSEDGIEKTVYSMTKEGRKHLKQLMHKFASDPVKFYFDFNTFIINIYHVPKKDGLIMLKALKNQFYDRKKTLEFERKLHSHFLLPALSIIHSQQCMIAQTMIDWIEAFIEEYDAGGEWSVGSRA